MAFFSANANNLGIAAAATLIAAAPMVVAYMFLQRYFIAGMVAGAAKWLSIRSRPTAVERAAHWFIKRVVLHICAVVTKGFSQSVSSDQPLTSMALGPITPGADIPDIRGLYAGPDLNGLEQTPA